ncbi:hypothetical protein BKM35_22185 [Salmonella enterica]|nr:hypothetical protein [Salmonella enterica]
MPIIKLTGYTGELPKVIPRLLNANAAQIAQNCRLEDGSLTPIRQPRAVATVEGTAGQIKTIYKHKDTWYAWESEVNAAPGPVADDRLYYTGDGKPKMRIGDTIYDLAVPYPTSALTGTVQGEVDTKNITTLLYVYTWVTEYGEESEASPVSNEVDWSPGLDISLSGFQPVPDGRGITRQRIYRSQSSLQHGTALYFIAERDATAENYLDPVGLNDISEPLPSPPYSPPPDTMAGLTALPNGMLAAFNGKQLLFCEPYILHAWPEAYILTTDYNIVALGAFGNTIIVATEGTPYIVSGTHPSNMVMEKLELNLPCINSRGVVDLGYSVAYPSNDGLVLVDTSGAKVVSDSVMTRDQWKQLGPGSLVAGQVGGRYFASYAFVDKNSVPRLGSFLMDVTGEIPFMISTSHQSEACFYDITTGSLYILKGTTIYEWDNPTAMPEYFDWKSKEFVLPAPTNFGAIMIEGEENSDTLANIITYNEQYINLPSIGGEFSGSALNEYDLNGDMLLSSGIALSFQATIYADKEQVALVSKQNTMVRLPSGFLARIWEIEIVGNLRISDVVMAGTGAEMRRA